MIKVTVLYVNKGVICLLEGDGNVAYYKQEGIDELSDDIVLMEIAMGKLDSNVMSLPVIPKQYNLEFEDIEIMGKVSRRYEVG